MCRRIVDLCHILIIRQNVVSVKAILINFFRLAGVLFRTVFDCRKFHWRFFGNHIVDISKIVRLVGNSDRFSSRWFSVACFFAHVLRRILCNLCGKLLRTASLAVCDRLCGCFIHSIGRKVHGFYCRFCGCFRFFWSGLHGNRFAIGALFFLRGHLFNHVVDHLVKVLALRDVRINSLRLCRTVHSFSDALIDVLLIFEC